MAENGANTLPSHTETLIVGAGIVGCATAYHLTDMGRSDVTVVDQGSIPKTGGSTVHAPSGLMQTSPSKTMSELAQETRDLYSEVGGWEENGAIEIATTDERWDYLHHRMDQAQAWDVEGPELLTPSEVTDHVPILDAEKIHGGYHSPHDGRMDTVELLDGLRKAAEERGATFHELTTVTDIETNGGGVETVVTSEGRISVDDVVIAGNIWAPLLGDMVGVDIPLVPCAHQYAVTDSVPELDGWDHDVEQPWVRHQDQAMYFRQHGDGYGIGNYNHDPLLVTPDDIAAYDDAIQEEPVYDYVPGRGSRHEAFKQPSTRPFTDEHFEDAWAETKRLFPAFEDSDIVKGFNGMFAFTPDHMPILGEAPEVDGFWVAAGSWLTQAGGVGKVMAELMETGTPSTNIDAAHITRFQPHTASPSFVWDRGYESYAEVYDIHHPRGSFATHRNLRESPFARYQTSLDAEFYDMSGWERARWYGANEGLLDDYDVPDRSGWEAQLWSPIEGAEHQAVRDGVGMCDLTVFTTVDISGDDAAEFAQRVFTNDVDVPVGDAVYTLMCNEAGGIIGDVTVLRTAPDGFYVSSKGCAAVTKQLA
jgi:glycine/D-amino acid oxidase-like deaminating enzyme